MSDTLPCKTFFPESDCKLDNLLFTIDLDHKQRKSLSSINSIEEIYYFENFFKQLNWLRQSRIKSMSIPNFSRIISVIAA